ncbi:Acyl-CoA N-acyltransferases (NAT) superfamily protein [Striga hermonthica]|uniref:Acyl-CoA N-acyltransferases (NAT) superfamily protein n=1 Tax=Striga hermonthica TaxID=68872 RepID=A0A9N7MGQ8_STRHE|nr:Acyl-CoA N-acyltransferases (NAT) superfamily protein [Striga hermonthica]
MELKGNFLPQFKVGEAQSAQLPSTAKRDSVSVVGMFCRVANSSRESFPSQYYRWKNLEVHGNSDQSIRHLALSKSRGSKLPELSFDRQQLTDQECSGLRKRNFGRFVAREAILDEEYWTAAWLRAEAHWESLSYMRHADSYKRKYAEEEFYALKRRCFGQQGKSLNCFCFVAVKKEDKNVRRTVLNSIVGTLDLSIRQFLQGEKYPGEIKRLPAVFSCQEPFGMHKYAYIANVCVAKFARRQGIASNMIYLATDVAIIADNKPARDLYKKTGFEVVEAASCPMAKDQRILMSMELTHLTYTESVKARQTSATSQSTAEVRRRPIVEKANTRRLLYCSLVDQKSDDERQRRATATVGAAITVGFCLPSQECRATVQVVVSGVILQRQDRHKHPPFRFSGTKKKYTLRSDSAAQKKNGPSSSKVDLQWRFVEKKNIVEQRPLDTATPTIVGRRS